jgi:hypothetical protein
MKKIPLSLKMMILGTIITMNAMENPYQEAYQKINALIAVPYMTKIDWQAIFSILDLMPNLVNEYRTPNLDSIPNLGDKKYITFNPESFEGDTLLLVAIEKHNFSAVKTLLDKYNANPNLAYPFNGMTPLMLAMPNIKMVRLLINYGANPNQTDSRGENSFHYAEYYPAIMKVLEKSLQKRTAEAA